MPLDGVATALLENVGKRLWGFKPPIMRHIVTRLGALGALAWFATNIPRYERTMKALGPLRVHLACVEISLINACPHCTAAHALAFELVHLRDRGTLFPLDERAIVDLHRLPRDAIREQLAAALAAADLRGHEGLFDRVAAAVDGRLEPTTAEDRQLAHLAKMFAVLNACATGAGLGPEDQAHDPINKDLSLQKRYADLRAASSRTAPRPG